MSEIPPMPRYRDWEWFWDLHLTPEFRETNACVNDNCHALASLDALREFFAALAGPTADAQVPVSVNNMYVHIANHLGSLHGFDLRDESEYDEGDLAHMDTVIEQLYYSYRHATNQPLIFMVQTVLADARDNPN